MSFGSSHTTHTKYNLDFKSFIESESYKKTMEQIFWLEIWKKMNVSK
jgi:hypothetical protein